MARQYLPSQEALLSLLAEPQECGGDMRRQAVTLGKLGRIVEGHQLRSTTNIDSFVREGTWRAMPEPCKVISSRLHMSIFLTKLSEMDSAVWLPILYWDLYYRWQRVHTEHMWQAWNSLVKRWHLKTPCRGPWALIPPSEILRLTV